MRPIMSFLLTALHSESKLCNNVMVEGCIVTLTLNLNAQWCSEDKALGVKSRVKFSSEEVTWCAYTEPKKSQHCQRKMQKAHQEAQEAQLKAEETCHQRRKEQEAGTLVRGILRKDPKMGFLNAPNVEVSLLVHVTHGPGLAKVSIATTHNNVRGGVVLAGTPVTATVFL